MALQPYERPDAVDRYYAELADVVFQRLIDEEVNIEYELEISDLKLMAIRMTMFFEDVVSQIGIWAAAVGEFERRYGYPVPFYEPNNDYEKGYLNIEDVRYVFWNEIQSFYNEDTFIDPHNVTLKLFADDVFDIFDAQWETAPENTRKKEFVHNSEAAGNYWKARKLFEWFVAQSFVSTMFHSSFEKEFNGFMKLNNNLDVEESMAGYNAMTSISIDGRRNILSIPASEWFAFIRKDEKDIWESFKLNYPSMYKYLRTDGSKIWFLDAVADTEVAVETESIHTEFLKIGFDDNRYYLFTTAEFNGKRYQIGIMSAFSGVNALQMIDEMKRQKKFKDSEKAAHELFLKHSGGKEMMFFGSKQELVDFYAKMGMNNFDIPKISDCYVAITFEDSATSIYFGDVVKCICSPDNPYYDKKVAEDVAFGLLINSHDCDYHTIEYLTSHNYLNDAVQRDESDKYFVRKYNRFIVDYSYFKTKG